MDSASTSVVMEFGENVKTESSDNYKFFVFAFHDNS